MPWYVCYMSALQNAQRNAVGEYFVFLAEDNQFICRGNIIQNCISVLKKMGKSSHMINFTGMQNYKYFKENNHFEDAEYASDVKYFPIINTKWDPTYLCHKSLYQQLGEFKLGNEADPHATINNFIKKSKELEHKRSYIHIPVAIWFHNDHRDKYIHLINKNTRLDPDYILFNMRHYTELSDKANRLFSRPLGTDDMFDELRIVNEKK